MTRPVLREVAVRMAVVAMTALTMAALTGLAGCAHSAADNVQQLRVQVLATLPHDTIMYTEGLEIHDGMLYEGSGLVGQSRLRTTIFGGTVPGSAVPGSAVPGSTTQREITLPAPLFGEGLTVAGPRLWQLTWTNGVAIERDPITLVQRRQVNYQGEGWGLCYDGRRLVMSNGSDQLTFRDPVTFAPSGHVNVQQDGTPVSELNELECAGGVVWANVFLTDDILRINPATGAVTAVVDASGLFHTTIPGDVLNGIATVPGTDEFLLTGKHWPSLFRVRFVADPR